MSEAQDIEIVVNALKSVPTQSLKIIELANKIPISGGLFDPQVLSDLQEEIHQAAAEAETYGAQTIMAVQALSSIGSINETDNDEGNDTDGMVM